MIADSRTDIVIAGGGLVGLAAAIALKVSEPSLSVTLVDGARPASEAQDRRASAISAAARRMLARFGIWERLAAEAEPIREMVVTDSRLGDAVRPTFLTFEGDVEPGEPFAHMVENGHLIGALSDKARQLGIRFHADHVANFELAAPVATVRLGSGGILTTSLLVAADGVRSRLRDLAGIATIATSYGQSGIVATVEHERPHRGIAVEHFLPAGPFAILPLRGNRSSLVWTEATDRAADLVRADRSVIEEAAQRRFGHALGKVSLVGESQAFPLGLSVARQFVKARFALCGDAAHAIHPIAGQGLNLGLRDAAALAETVVDGLRLGLDPGNAENLGNYERWRRGETLEMAFVTDGLNRLFSNDIAPVRMVRDIGLGVVDRLPSLKAFLIRRAAGLGGKLPQLLSADGV